MNRLLFLLLLTSSALFAQQQPRPAPGDSTFFRPVIVPMHLKPIERTFGNQYFYGGRRLRSVHALHIPFYELNDPTVLRYYRQSRLLNTVGSVIGFVPLGYVLTQRGGINRDTYWQLFFGSLGTTIILNIVANGKVGRAVKTYNQRLAGVPALGLSVAPTLPGGVAVGPGVRWSL